MLHRWFDFCAGHGVPNGFLPSMPCLLFRAEGQPLLRACPKLSGLLRRLRAGWSPSGRDVLLLLARMAILSAGR